MKRYFGLTLILTILVMFKLCPIEANAMTSEEISQKMSDIYFFDIDYERDRANPDTPIPVNGYTDKEVEMICSIVMRETGYGDVLSKQLVTNVIRNRVNSSKFPNDVESVLTAEDQFPTIVNWYTNEWPVTSATRLAVCYTLMSNEDVSNGALYFYATYITDSEIISWFENLTFCCEHYGQRYFK
ncbi:MAG: cell wall hydrolase [Ruminococcus sp.]|nr:cell wall hydrolase [Ruminococcus sp.]